MKGFVIGQTSIANFSDHTLERVGDLFMNPQQAFIKRVNKLASFKTLSVLIIFFRITNDDYLGFGLIEAFAGGTRLELPRAAKGVKGSKIFN